MEELYNYNDKKLLSPDASFNFIKTANVSYSTFNKGAVGLTKRKDVYLVPSRSLDWDIPLSQEYNSKLIKLAQDKGISLKITRSFPSPYKEHYNLFIRKLFMWEKLPIEKSISIEEIFYRCLSEGPSFAKVLKDLRFYSMKDKITESFTGEEDSRETFGYDSFFNEGSLIHWTEDNSDSDWSSIEHILDEDILNDLMEILREKLRSIKTKIYIPQKEEVLLNLRNASTFTFDDKQKASVFRVLNHKSIKDFTPNDYLIGKRQVVNVSPGSCRDTCIATMPTLFKIKHNSMILNQICDKFKSSLMCRRRKIAKRLDLLQRDANFLMLDMRKIGWTYPKEYILRIGKVLEEEGIPNFLQDFSNLFVIDGKEYFQPKAGYCLGWQNELPTLHQCLLLSYIRKKGYKKIKAAFFNDDSVWMIPNLYKESEVHILSLLIIRLYSISGILVNPKKHILSKANVFCELYHRTDYYDWDGSKRQIVTNILATVKILPNTILVMEYLRSALPYLDEVTMDLYEDTIEYLLENGLLTKQMVEMPFSFGGLTLNVNNGFHRDYEDYQFLPKSIQQECWRYRKAVLKNTLPIIYDTRNSIPVPKETPIDVICKYKEKLLIDSDKNQEAREDRLKLTETLEFKEMEITLNIKSLKSYKEERQKLIYDFDRITDRYARMIGKEHSCDSAIT